MSAQFKERKFDSLELLDQCGQALGFQEAGSKVLDLPAICGLSFLPRSLPKPISLCSGGNKILLKREMAFICSLVSSLVVPYT